MVKIITRRRRNRDNELKFHTVMVPMEIAICPSCGTDMKKEVNIEAQSLYHWKCDRCGYKH